MSPRTIVSSIFCLAAVTAVAAPRPAPNTTPVLTHVGLVASNVLCVVVETDGFIPSRQEPYVPQPGDEQVVKREHNGEVTELVLVRDGQELGWLTGASNDWLCTFEQNVCAPLDADAIANPGSFAIASPTDSAYREPRMPRRVVHKTKPINWVVGTAGDPCLRYMFFLNLPTTLQQGSVYTLECRNFSVQPTSVTFTNNADMLRSEAVHVNHLGFRPDDPAKRAYLSTWLGTGGPLLYPKELPFHLVDVETGEHAYEGTVSSGVRVFEPEYMRYVANNNLTDVWRLDFSGFSRPGTYRVVVDGIGCSYPFVISDKAYHDGLRTAMRGFYHQRAGIELGPPYTDFIRPRNFRTADGITIHVSEFAVTDNSGGQDSVFTGLLNNRTDQTLTNVWGGYHDAGDWDRRVQHLDASYRQLELCELFPEQVAEIDLNIPESTNALPDILDEALFNLDFYRRLQTPDGGVRHGIESAAHPRKGEVSWRESLTVMAFAPDIWSTYCYVANAARAAFVLRTRDQDLAARYLESALRGMRWAESNLDAWRARDASAQMQRKVTDRRNLAAIELYRLTGDTNWHNVFLSETRLRTPRAGWYPGADIVHQEDAAFIYTRLPDDMADRALKAKAEEAILVLADNARAYGASNAFNLAHHIESMPRLNGFFSTCFATALPRAHLLTGDARYLAALVLGNGFGLGANPMNMTLTTGLGHDSPRNPLHIDSRRTGQASPEGLCLYGICDKTFGLELNENSFLWPFFWRLHNECAPSGYGWPVTECYFDVCTIPMQNEFTIMGPMEHLAYSLGYLALRP